MIKPIDILRSIFFFAVIAVLLLSCSCVHTTIEKTADSFKVNRWAVFSQVKTGGIEYDPVTGFITLIDYNNDGGTATTEAIVRAAISEALKVAP